VKSGRPKDSSGSSGYRKLATQVFADATGPETAARELGALAEAGERFPQAQQVLLTLTRNGAPAAAARKIPR
jgi:hypothetical protein